MTLLMIFKLYSFLNKILIFEVIKKNVERSFDIEYLGNNWTNKKTID